ncbi:HNH endonuclease family protein, partial [Avibacterium paragallinarum]|uniref:HNH endonuclease family protein n=1 Tax=Avibacterium paragallinarum TaxID=728 RepID=UPI0039FCBBCD
PLDRSYAKWGFYVWRRFIVGVPTNALNKLFMSLYKEIDQNDYLFSLQKNLLTRTGAQRFPKDNEVKENLKVKDVYNIKPKNRTYLLERIENFENKESVIIEGNNEITIEHIFPQNPDPKWKIDLGEEQYNTIKENYLNTIANLTLSGNNGTLGNKDFITKRDMENAGYKDSRLWLNKYLSTAERWNLEELDNRFTILSERFLKIWQIPDIQIDSHNNDEVNIFDAEEPTHKKLEYAIFFNQKIQVNQVAKLYAEVFKKLFELQAELFFTTDLSEKIEIKKDPKELRQAIPINEIYFIEGNLDNINKFERIKYALQRFQAEEELTIKYAREEPND